MCVLPKCTRVSLCCGHCDERAAHCQQTNAANKRRTGEGIEALVRDGPDVVHDKGHKVVLLEHIKEAWAAQRKHHAHMPANFEVLNQMHTVTVTHSKRRREAAAGVKHV